MRILVLVEYDDSGLKKTTLSTITAAKKIGDDLTALVVGEKALKIASEVAKLEGVKKVLVNASEVYNYGKAESISNLIADIGKSYSHIFASASSFGKNILPRVAALLDVAPISDIIAVISPDIFSRPIYAGNAIATLQSKDPIKVITVRSTAFDAVASQEAAAPIETIVQVFDYPKSHYISQNLSVSSRPELTSARVIVSGGRAFQSKEKFDNLLTPLSEVLNAAIGSSRAAVDAGYADNDYQVGQTGKIVAPELYIAIGISGAIQHLAGMKDSKIIVAINKDPEAEMMKIADYALKADIFEAIPELTKKLSS